MNTSEEIVGRMSYLVLPNAFLNLNAKAENLKLLCKFPLLI